MCVFSLGYKGKPISFCQHIFGSQTLNHTREIRRHLSIVHTLNNFSEDIFVKTCPKLTFKTFYKTVFYCEMLCIIYKHGKNSQNYLILHWGSWDILVPFIFLCAYMRLCVKIVKDVTFGASQFNTNTCLIGVVIRFICTLCLGFSPTSLHQNFRIFY